MSHRGNDVSGDARSAPVVQDDRAGEGTMSPLMLQLVLSFGGAESDPRAPGMWPSLSRTTQRVTARRQ
jgi:hypothetical protein